MAKVGVPVLCFGGREGQLGLGGAGRCVGQTRKKDHNKRGSLLARKRGNSSGCFSQGFLRLSLAPFKKIIPE